MALSAGTDRESSPRAWGCFPHGPVCRHRQGVFPTCVGVFPREVGCDHSVHRLPHVRGGVSIPAFPPFTFNLSSPRAWGCFSLKRGKRPIRLVFPTCVGVFLTFGSHSLTKTCLPHVRGGVSRAAFPKENFSASSPRAWGCFRKMRPASSRTLVFPTCVGVFPRQATGEGASSRLPHVRGGVSGKSKAGLLRPLSSPRAWGCFRGPRKKPGLFLVFPTCVGVFLSTGSFSTLSFCLPHVRGGVSVLTSSTGELL